MTGAKLNGRALAQTAVTLDANAITGNSQSSVALELLDTPHVSDPHLHRPNEPSRATLNQKARRRCRAFRYGVRADRLKSAAPSAICLTSSLGLLFATFCDCATLSGFAETRAAVY